jgi:hypothetical protein
MSKIFLLQCHWLVSSKTGLLFEGHLPFQSFLPEESGSSHIEATTSVLSRRPTIIHIQNQNKVVELLVAWLFTKPHVWKMFQTVMINHC